LWRDGLEGKHKQPPGLGMRLALGRKLLLKVLPTSAHLESGRPWLVVCLVSYWFGYLFGVQPNEHAVPLLLTIELTALYAHSYGLRADSQSLGGLGHGYPLFGHLLPSHGG
jgi:hypothetical protein